MVRDPAGQPEAASVYRLRREQRMVEAAQPHADHEQHRQTEPLYKIRSAVTRIERDTEPSRPFDYHHVGKLRKPGIGQLELPEIDFDPRIASRDVRRDRRLETIRIDELAWRRNIARREYLFDILVAQTVRVPLRAGGNRFHAYDTHSARRVGMQQRAGHERLADAGVGAGDKNTVTGQI